MKRQYELGALDGAAHSALDVIPFEPPKDGRVLSNYLVEYEPLAKELRLFYGSSSLTL